MNQHETKHEKHTNNDDDQLETFSEMASVTTKSGVAGKLLVISLIVVSLAVTAFVGFAIFRGINGADYVNADSYQEVTLSDGRVYYGKITDMDSAFMTLENVYYMQQNFQTASEANPQQEPITLTKLGEERSCPSDNLYINRDQVIQWTNIRSEGEVAKAIESHLATHNTGNETPCSTLQ